MKRVGLLGGTFDPPHDGHLRLAHLAWEHLGLDELRFMPATIAPLKSTPAADPGQRLEMLKQMLVGTPYKIEDTEMKSLGPSFTAATLEILSKREPGSRWILIMGSDQAALFPRWHSPEKVLGMASIAIAQRPGEMAISKAPLPGILSARLVEAWSGAPGEAMLLPGTDLELSSTAIRAQLAMGEDPTGVPPLVKNAIMQNTIYR